MVAELSHPGLWDIDLSSFSLKMTEAYGIEIILSYSTLSHQLNTQLFLLKVVITYTSAQPCCFAG